MGSAFLQSTTTPARVYIRFGEAIRLDAPPEAAGQQAVVDRLNEQVRSELQALIDDILRRRTGIYWSSYDAGDAPRGITPPTIVVPAPRQAEAA